MQPGLATPTAKPDRAGLLALYQTMVTIREFELAGSRLFAEGRLPGFLHVSIGQEAVAAGVCANLRPSDRITSTHRGHGHCVAKGGDLKRMMAELFGRADGYLKGRAGSMHIADPEIGILGANGIVGGGLAMAVGAGYAAKVQGTDGVAVAFFGDGAVAEGSFHESLNLASLWQLPVIFVCENNLYAEMSHISTQLTNPDVHRKAAGYDLPGVVVDGNDVLAVYAAAGEAIGRARAGGGPTLLECKTYRWHGHFEGDPMRYREPAELQAWKQRDPIPRLWAYLVAQGAATEAELAAIGDQVEQEIAAAIAFSEASPRPDPAVVTEDVY